MGANGERPKSISDLMQPPDRRPLRQLPRLVVGSVRLVWAAGRQELLSLLALQLVSAGLLGGQVLVVRQLLAGVLAASGGRAGLGPALPPVILLAVFLGLAGVASALQDRQRQVLMALVTRHTTGRMLDVTTAVSLDAFDRPAFHDRLARALAGQGRPYQLTQGVVQLIQGGTNVVGVAIALWILQPLLIPLVALAFLPLALSAVGAGRVFSIFAAARTPRDRQRNYLMNVLIDKSFAKEVRAYATARFLRRIHDRLYEEHLAELRRVTTRRLLTSLAAALASVALVTTLVIVLVQLVLGGSMTLAQAGAALTALIFLGFSLPTLLFAVSQLSECAFFIEDHESFLELRPAVEARRARGQAPGGFDQLTVEHVSFTYPNAERPALRDVSLQVRRGEVVALVGENGSGKTTLAKLLCQLYLPDAGRICWDGADTAGMDPDQVRASIALIFQDFVQYHLSARQNVAIGRHERFDDLPGVRSAARQADADELLAGLPDGYETMLGPLFHGGTELSTGQWQRVALARAFFRDAPFLILDEPTAALDPRSEHALFARIRELTRGRTVLLISHRFSSVRSADRIYVLKEGEIVEEGSHHELMARRGRYAELFELQAAAYLT